MRNMDFFRRARRSFARPVTSLAEAKTTENTLIFCFNILLCRLPNEKDRAFHVGRSTPTQLCTRILKSAEFNQKIFQFADADDPNGLPHSKKYTNDHLEAARSASQRVFIDLDADKLADWASLIKELKAYIENDGVVRNIDAWKPLRPVKREPQVAANPEPAMSRQKAPNPTKSVVAEATAVVKNKLTPTNQITSKLDQKSSKDQLSPESRQDINLGFQLILGRNAPDSVLVPSRLSGGFMGHLSKLLESWEFETRVLGPLMSGKPIKHYNLSLASETAFRKTICSKMQLSKARTEVALEAESWESFLLATVLHSDTLNSLVSKLGSVHRHILIAMRDAFEWNYHHGLDIRNSTLSIGLDCVLSGKCQAASLAKAGERITVRGASLKSGALHSESTVVSADDGWFEFALNIDEQLAQKQHAILLEICFDDGRVAARHVLRCVLANSRERRELANILQDSHKTNAASLLEKINGLVSASPFSEAPRLAAADIALSVAANPEMALRYLPTLVSETAEYKRARIRALGAANQLNAASALCDENPKIYSKKGHIADFLKRMSAQVPDEAAPVWMHDARKVIESHKRLRGDVKDYDALISTLHDDDFDHLLDVMVEFFVTPSFIIKAMLLGENADFKARQKRLANSDSLSEPQALALKCATPVDYVRNKNDLVQCAEHLLTINRFFAAREFLEKASYLFRDDAEIDKLRVAILRRSRVPRDKKIAFDEVASWYLSNLENSRALKSAESLYTEIRQLDPLFFSEAGEKAREAKFAELVTEAQSQSTRAAALTEISARLNATLRFQEAYDILTALVSSLPPGARQWPLRHILRCCEPLRRTDEGLEYAEMLLQEHPGDYAAIQYIKACRQIGQPEKAEMLPAAIAEKAGLALLRELARNKFFVADFEAAHKAVDALMNDHPQDVELQLLYGATLVELRDLERLEKLLANVHVDHEQVLYLERELQRYALNYFKGDPDGAIASLNEMFATFGCQSLKLSADDGTKGMYDRLIPSGTYQKAPHSIIGPNPIFDGPLVSIVMTAYEAGVYIETSVRSLLQQSYRNIEIIIVVDKSPDDTIEIVRRLAASDPRIRYIDKTTNDGTYVSKNMGIMQARGKYIALQDSDDWSHPDRIAKSIAVLEQTPQVMALTTDWLRITTDGELVVKAGGQISHVCCISIVFRRQEVLDAIGFYDSVRIEADMEYIRRLTVKFGASAVARLRWPLLFGRAHSASLTASEEYGITRVGFTEPRQLYQAAQINWHKDIIYGEAEGVTPFPMAERLFDAPDLMLPDKGKGKKVRTRSKAAKPAGSTTKQHGRTSRAKKTVRANKND